MARAEVLLKRHLGDRGIARFKAEDVLHVATTPLVNCLVVVTDDADLGAKISECRDDGFLNWVEVLVFVDGDMPNPVF